MLFATLAPAHARLTYPTPRNTSSGIKIGPCGVAKTNTPTVFTAGQQVTVSWTETVQHPGYYRIAYSPGSPAPDNDFDQHVLKTNITNPTGLTASQSTMITLPNITCTNCTLQLIQVMTEDPANPSPYFSCADFALVAPPDAGTPDAGSGGGAGGGSGGGADGGSGGGGGAGGGSGGGAGGGNGSGGGADGGSGGGGAGSSSEDGGVSAVPADSSPAEFPEATGGVGCAVGGFAPALLAPALLALVLRRRVRCAEGSERWPRVYNS